MKINRSNFNHLWAEIRWIVIGAAWLVSLGLGYYGFTLLSRDTDLPLPVTERIYRTVQLIGLESGTMEGNRNWALEISRFLLPGLTAYAAFQALSVLFREQVQWLQLWRLKDHCIVCGLGRKGIYFVNDLIANGQRLVLIDKNLDKVTANDYRRRGAIVLTGDATDSETLLSARITRAKNLVCLLGQDQENLKIAHLAFNLSKNNQNQLTCIIHLASQDLLGLVKRSELTLSSTESFLLESFNIYRRTGNQIIRRDLAWNSDASSLPEHILIIGLGRLGQNLVLQAGYQWFTQDKQEKLTISLIDVDANAKAEKLTNHQPELKTVANLQAINVDLSMPQSLEIEISKIDRIESVSRIYVCIGDPVLSLQITLALRENLAFSQIPFFVRVQKTSGLADLFETPIVSQSSEGELHLFDIHEETCSYNLVIGGTHELLARQLRENYLRSQKTPEAKAQLTLSWEMVSPEEKEANREQASRICSLINSRNYHLSPLQKWDARNFTFPEDQLEQMAQLEHQLWCRWKRSKGWKYGPQRDDKLMINPDIIPWEDLPPHERKKNKDFIQALPRLLADIGFQILRRPSNPN